jgi:hypothetical protein
LAAQGKAVDTSAHEETRPDVVGLHAARFKRANGPVLPARGSADTVT